ncbi:Rab family, other [Strigomonas culicis]|uniref:Rab family, other n=1 Tax=Strigomonas culicis TaxID=28005 RepID=S9WFM2_9TRYP|nr:Rab family, other [Strigomonas culicis]|eukprot:EPY34545.1 Rab family, other [Strigomonas culicis]
MLDTVAESIKVIVVGDGNVGKTCMLRRFVRGDFLEQYKKTIGAEYMEKDVFLRSTNTTVQLMLWDTSGQEVFNSLTQAYYRGAGAAVLAFSTVDRDSFEHLRGWKEKVESVCGPITMVMCQTKMDLAHEAVTTNEEAEELAAQLAVPLFRVSTKDDFNVTQMFEFTAQQCVEAGQPQSGKSTPSTVAGAGGRDAGTAAAETSAVTHEESVEPCGDVHDEAPDRRDGGDAANSAPQRAPPVGRTADGGAGPSSSGTAAAAGQPPAKPSAPLDEHKRHHIHVKTKPTTVNLREADALDKKKKKKKMKCSIA